MVMFICQSDYPLHITGNAPQLGEWKRDLPMKQISRNIYKIEIDLPVGSYIEYKFKQNGNWETRRNRIVTIDNSSMAICNKYDDVFVYIDNIKINFDI